MTVQARNDTREWIKIIIGAAAVFAGIFYAGKVDQKVDALGQDVRDIKAYIYPQHLSDQQQAEKNGEQADYIKHLKVK